MASFYGKDLDCPGNARVKGMERKGETEKGEGRKRERRKERGKERKKERNRYRRTGT